MEAWREGGREREWGGGGILSEMCAKESSNAVAFGWGWLR